MSNIKFGTILYAPSDAWYCMFLCLSFSGTQARVFWLDDGVIGTYSLNALTALDVISA